MNATTETTTTTTLEPLPAEITSLFRPRTLRLDISHGYDDRSLFGREGWSKKVKALSGGRYNDCRGNDLRRYVKLPTTTEGLGLAAALIRRFGASLLIFDAVGPARGEATMRSALHLKPKHGLPSSTLPEGEILSQLISVLNRYEESLSTDERKRAVVLKACEVDGHNHEARRQRPYMLAIEALKSAQKALEAVEEHDFDAIGEFGISGVTAQLDAIKTCFRERIGVEYMGPMHERTGGLPKR